MARWLVRLVGVLPAGPRVGRPVGWPAEHRHLRVAVHVVAGDVRLDRVREPAAVDR